MKAFILALIVSFSAQAGLLCSGANPGESYVPYPAYEIVAKIAYILDSVDNDILDVSEVQELIILMEGNPAIVMDCTDKEEGVSLQLVFIDSFIADKIERLVLTAQARADIHNKWLEERRKKRKERSKVEISLEQHQDSFIQFSPLF